MDDINIDSLYREVQDDLNQLVGPLFELGEIHVRKRGTFVPFGATLDSSGTICLEAATTGEEYESAIEVLPILHDGLRAKAKESQLLALAICEWVNIDRDGKRSDAMKVLVEHGRGLTVAFYVPCQKKFMKGWQFESMFALPAEAEVKAWEIDTAS